MAEKNPFSYESVREIHIKEMKSSSLTRLELNFYEEFFKHLGSLEKTHQKLVQAGRSDTDTVLLSEEIRKLKSLINSIYERRERKIIFLAQVEARGSKPNTKNLTDLERILYDELVLLLKRTRSKLETGKISVPYHDTTTSQNEQSNDNQYDAQKSREDAQIISNEQVPSGTNKTQNGSKQGKGEDQNFSLVQILEDNVAFQDEDSHKYFLKKEDVITLPVKYAQILVKRGAARVIDNTF